MKILRAIAIAVITPLFVLSCGKKTVTPVSSTSMSAHDIDATSPLDKPFRLKDAKELDVDKLFELMPLIWRPSYEKSSFDPKTGATVVTNLTFGDVRAGKGFNVKRAEFYGVNIDNIESLKDPHNAALDAPLTPVLVKLRLFDVEKKSSGAREPTLRIGAVEVDSLRIREGGVPRESKAHGLAAIANVFDVAGIYLRDVAIGAENSSGEQGGSAVDFSAADLRVVGVGGGNLAAIIARDVKHNSRRTIAAANVARGLGPMAAALVQGPLRKFIAPDDQQTAIGTIEWRNITFAGLMAYGLKGEKPPISARNLIDLGAAQLSDVETSIGGRRFSFTPDVNVSAMEFAWLAPSKIRAVTRGGTYDFTALVSEDEKEAISLLKQKRLDRVRGDSDFAYDWSADRGEAALSAGYDSDGFADLDIDISLEGLDLKTIEAARAAGASRPVADMARLKLLSLVIADEQMLGAFYELSALQTGGTAKEVRAGAPALMRLTQLELKRSNPRVASYIDAVAEFLEDGGTLEVTAAPETPVPLEALGAAAAGGPDTMAAAVNLTVTRRK